METHADKTTNGNGFPRDTAHDFKQVAKCLKEQAKCFIENNIIEAVKWNKKIRAIMENAFKREMNSKRNGD